MDIVQLKQLQGILEEAKKDGPPPNHIRGMLVRYNDVLTNKFLKKLSPRNR